MESLAVTAGPSVEDQLAEMRAMFAQQQALMGAMLQAQAANMQAVSAPHVVPGRTVRVLWEAFLKSFPGKAPKWARRSTWYFESLTFPFEGETICLADQPWTRLTPQMGEAWWLELRATEKDNPRDDENNLLSPAYCNRIRTALQSCFSYHGKQAIGSSSRVRGEALTDDVTENPIRRWPKAKKEEEGKRLGGFENEDQLADFMKNAHPVLVEMGTVGVWCGGMRKDEARLLRFSMINFAARTITLPGWFTKSGRDRTFPVTPPCMEILERRRNSRRSDFVWPAAHSVDGHPYGATTVEGWVRDARHAWGVLLNGNEPVVFHHFRHTFAKWSLLFGDPATVVMEYGGWATFEVFKGYARANQAMIEQSRMNKTRTIRDAINEAAGKISAPTQRRAAQRSSRHETRPREAIAK
jgi:integrase